MGKYDQTIQQVLDVVGGQDNIKTFEHCATRLRIILKDDSVVDKEKAEEIEYVKGYFFNTGQHQFIFGTGTDNDVYAALKAEIGGAMKKVAIIKMKSMPICHLPKKLSER